MKQPRSKYQPILIDPETLITENQSVFIAEYWGGGCYYSKIHLPS